MEIGLGSSRSDVRVVLGVRSTPEKLGECLRMLCAQEGVASVTRTVGEYDAVALAGFSSMVGLSSFLKVVYATTGIGNCSVMRVLQEVKRS